MARVARQVALALNDADLRSSVYEALQASAYPEHKLHFRTVLQSADLGLLDRMVLTSGTSKQHILASLDSVMDLEFYMPVKDHWARWNGGPDLLVATAHRDEDIPIAFDLSGSAVALSSARVPPSTPTLGLVPAETDFSLPPRAAVSQSSAISETGLEMTFSYIENGHSDYEGFLMGDPEFEVLTMTRPAHVLRPTADVGFTQWPGNGAGI